MTLRDNPNFFNPPGDDYQLITGSPAIDVGVNVGVVTDFEGSLRPVGAGYDIGYDEYSGAPTAVVLEKMSAEAVGTRDAESSADPPRDAAAWRGVVRQKSWVASVHRDLSMIGSKQRSVSHRDAAH